MASIVSCLVGSVISAACASSSSGCRPHKPHNTVAARRPEATTEKIDPCTTGTVRAQLAKERHDLSSARVVGNEKTKNGGHDDDGREPCAAPDDQIKIVVAVPGVRIEDVSVEVLDNVLRVRGETAKGAHTYAVDRRILLPSTADIDTVAATYADGEIAIAMRRKSGKRIAVVHEQKVVKKHVVEHELHELHEQEQEKKPKEQMKAPRREPAAVVEDEATAESIAPSMQRRSNARLVGDEMKELEPRAPGAATSANLEKIKKKRLDVLGGGDGSSKAEFKSEGAAPAAPPAPPPASASSASSEEEAEDEWEALPRAGEVE